MPRPFKVRNLTPLTAEQGRLVADNARLAAWHAGRMTRLRPRDFEDARDGGIDGLIRAARDHHGAPPGEFPAIASRYIFLAILNRLRGLDCPARNPPGAVVSLDAIDRVPSAGTVPARLPDDDEGFEDLVRSDDPLETRAMVLRYRDDMSLPEIAEAIGGTKWDAGRLIRRGLDRLRIASDAPPPRPGAPRC